MNELEQLYQQVILDHAKSPHGRGLIDAGAGAVVGQSHQVNPSCGDEVTLRVELADGVGADGDSGGAGAGGGAGGAAAGSSRVARVSWDGQGCTISQASISVLTDLVTGRSAAEAETLGALFRELMRTRGAGLDEAAEDELGDAAAFTGVSKYPARIKCALLGWAALRDALVTAGAQSRDLTDPTEEL